MTITMYRYRLHLTLHDASASITPPALRLRSQHNEPMTAGADLQEEETYSGQIDEGAR